MKNIEVTRAPDKLSCQSWRFYYDDRYHILRLTHYTVKTRPTTRHKYRDAGESWDTYRRGSSVAPPLPDDVAKQAIAQFTEGLTAVVGFPK